MASEVTNNHLTNLANTAYTRTNVLDFIQLTSDQFALPLSHAGLQGHCPLVFVPEWNVSLENGRGLFSMDGWARAGAAGMEGIPAPSVSVQKNSF